MNSPKPPTLKRRNPLWLAVALAGILGAAFPLFAWYGHANHGSQGILAAAAAFGICLAAGVTALLVSGSLQGTQLAVAGLTGSMLFRMGMPLAAIVVFQASSHSLLEAGVDGMIVAYYLLMLAVEMPLSLLLVRTNPTATGAT